MTQPRHELLEEARRIVAEKTLLLATTAHLRALLEELDESRALQAVQADRLTDKDRELADLREEACRMAQTIVRLEELNTKLTLETFDARQLVARAQRASEDLVRDLAPALEEVTAAFNFANRIRTELVQPRGPHSLTLHDQRPAAAGVSA